MQEQIPASTSIVATIQTQNAQNAIPNQMWYQCGYVTPVALVKIDVEKVQNQQQIKVSWLSLSQIAAART